MGSWLTFCISPQQAEKAAKKKKPKKSAKATKKQKKSVPQANISAKVEGDLESISKSLGKRNCEIAEKFPIIGFGAFGVVLSATWTSNEKPRKAAVKICPINSYNRCHWLERKRIIQKVASQRPNANVVETFETFVTRKYFIQIMQHGGAELFYLIPADGFLEPQARFLFKQMVTGVDYLHSVCKIAHRDLKISNMIVDSSGTLKIIDFDFAMEVEDAETLVRDCDGQCTIDYACPELLKDIPHSPLLADCWALGVCLYTLIFGQEPFSIGKSGSRDDVLTAQAQPLKLAKRTIDFAPCPLSPPLAELLLAILEPCYDKRSTLGAIKDSEWLRFYEEPSNKTDSFMDVADILFQSTKSSSLATIKEKRPSF